MAFSQFLRTYWPQNSSQRLRSWWWSGGSSKPRRIATFTVGAVLALMLIAVVAASFIDEPLRRRMEANLNTALKGYTVRIGKLDFHPIGLSLDLEDVSILQKENPDPPVAQIANWSASIAWPLNSASSAVSRSVSALNRRSQRPSLPGLVCNAFVRIMWL
jgi:hypothetical protein